MKTILCYGDSNTYGYNPENGFRYPYDLRWTSILEKNMEGRARVIPEGLNGRTTCFEDEIRPGRNGFAYLEPCLHSHGPLDLVVLMLGTNDLKIRFQLTPVDIGKAIERLVKKILEITPQKREDGKPSEILLVSPILIGENIREVADGETMGFERAYEYSKRLAYVYKEWADLYGIHFMDAAQFAEPSEKDACHLSAEGHRKLGEAISKACENILGAI